jgi:hypothetical protein
MKASSTKYCVAQSLKLSAQDLDLAAPVFALSFLATTSVGRDLHHFLAPAPVRAVKDNPAEAQRLAVLREARPLFWERIRALRALDAEWGL